MNSSSKRKNLCRRVFVRLYYQPVDVNNHLNSNYHVSRIFFIFLRQYHHHQHLEQENVKRHTLALEYKVIMRQRTIVNMFEYQKNIKGTMKRSFLCHIWCMETDNSTKSEWSTQWSWEGKKKRVEQFEFLITHSSYDLYFF